MHDPMSAVGYGRREEPDSLYIDLDLYIYLDRGYIRMVIRGSTGFTRSVTRASPTAVGTRVQATAVSSE
jgi:hypothetical protein